MAFRGDEKRNFPFIVAHFEKIDFLPLRAFYQKNQPKSGQNGPRYVPVNYPPLNLRF